MSKKAKAKARARKKLLWEAQDKSCFYCDNKLAFEDITVDHVFPKARGYTLGSNSVCSCHKCNHDKEDRIPTFQEVKKAIKLYEDINEVFNPHLNKEPASYIILKKGFIKNFGKIASI